MRHKSEKLVLFTKRVLSTCEPNNQCKASAMDYLPLWEITDSFPSPFSTWECTSLWCNARISGIEFTLLINERWVKAFTRNNVCAVCHMEEGSWILHGKSDLSNKRFERITLEKLGMNDLPSVICVTIYLMYRMLAWPKMQA